MSNDNEVIVQQKPESTLAQVAGGIVGGVANLTAFANQLDALDDAYKKIKEAAIKRTNENDWCALADKPYLEGSGAEKQARFFGVSWRILKEEKEVFEDGHYMYSIYGVFHWPHGETADIEVIGTRSTRDKFFTKYDWVVEGNKKTKKEKPLCDLLRAIDPGVVKKAAYTNMVVNGVSRLLGLRKPTWAELAAAGLDVDLIRKTKSVDYGGNQEGQEQSGDTKDKITALMTEMHGLNFGAQLKTLTAWTTPDGKDMPGKASLDGVKEKQMYVIYGNVKTAHGDWKKGGQKKTDPTPTNLLGVDSKRFNGAVKAIEAAKTDEEINNLVSMGDGIFTAEANQDLKDAGENAKKNLNDPQF